jgi:hypothetical protein
MQTRLLTQVRFGHEILKKMSKKLKNPRDSLSHLTNNMIFLVNITFLIRIIKFYDA